jgi:hypothetical protein
MMHFLANELTRLRGGRFASARIRARPCFSFSIFFIWHSFFGLFRWAFALDYFYLRLPGLESLPVWARTTSKLPVPFAFDVGCIRIRHQINSMQGLIWKPWAIYPNHTSFDHTSGVAFRRVSAHAGWIAMRTFRGFVRRLTASTAVWLMIGWVGQANAGPGAPGMATVVLVSGNARCSDDHRTWRTLKKGDRLKPGCLVQTAERSLVELILGDSVAATSISISLDGVHGDDVAEPLANVVRLAEESVLALNKLPDGRFGGTQAEETQLDLEAGQIAGSVTRMSADSKYEIKLAKGVAGVRGSSRYVLGSNGSARANSGSLVVVQMAGDDLLPAKVVTAGHKFDATTGTVVEAPLGEYPISPVKLGTAPTSSAAPGSNPPLIPGPPSDFHRALPSRRF